MNIFFLTYFSLIYITSYVSRTGDFVIEFFVIGRIYKRDIGNERNLIVRIF